MKRKESLIDIAKANDIPLNDLLAFNNIDPDKGLPPGSIIRISK
ncbi:MAG: LysM peptidoglycan-binding domain-containing protein [Saprospiraceae bacterium]|nr:LysM peptidoglycan-binding domain-containing protein [Saprospiraceae bacterium]MBK9744937.1 LysM peptidoglycan-binding domain-containing protein [Saprospiraceae bacterium]